MWTGCGQTAPSTAPSTGIEACTDMPCRRSWVVETWPTDPQSVAAAIAILEDPVEQMVYVQLLSERHPGQTSELCAQLPAGKSQDRCMRINARPHLQAPQKKKPAEAREQPSKANVDGSGILEPNFLLQPTRGLSSSFTQAEPVSATSCPDAALSRACQQDEARHKARQGQAAEAAARCTAIDQAHWREECFFQVAETLASARHPQALAQAVEMCAAAPSFYPQCLEHLSHDTRLLAPTGAPADRASWSAFAQRVETAGRQISSDDPLVAERFMSRAWGHGIAHSAKPVLKPSGNLLDAVGGVGAPHVRAMTAQKIWKLEHETPRAVSEWARRLNEALIEPQEEHAPTSRGSHRVQRDACNYWQRLLPGEEALPRVTFLGLSQRAHSEDPTIDNIISLLESAARAPQPASEPLLAEALGHDAALVRWTAARLMPALNQAHPALEAARSDADPLVRARARHATLPGCRNPTGPAKEPLPE